MSAGPSTTAPPRWVPPVLLTALSSAIVMHAGGELSLPRETRGTVLDWGGVFGQLVRLTGPWRVRISVDGETGVVAGGLPSEPPLEGGWRTSHRLGRLEVVQEVAPLDQPAGAARRLRLTSTYPRPVGLTIQTELEPYLLPVLVEGIRPVRFDVANVGAGGVEVRQHGFALRLLSAPSPSAVHLDGHPLGPGPFEGGVDRLTTTQQLDLHPGGSAEVRWELVGGLARELPPSMAGPAVPRPPVEAADRIHRADVEWVARTPEMDLPDAPELATAYRTARTAMRRLYTAPTQGLVGLVAGYPWYSAIWCRDLAVMLPAVLWLGDAEWVERSLQSVFRFQSRKMVEVLGGEPGELPMQLSPGPIFLYGTSDTTLRFPAVVERLHRHAGNTGALNEWGSALARIVEWARARTDPATGFLRHGGEAEAIENATAALSKIRYGIDSPDTTIWDSADRRDHAVDMQVLWWETLEMTGRLLAETGDAATSARYREEAATLGRRVAVAYLLPGGEYLADTILGGQPVPKVRPNALRAVSAGLLDPATSSRLVRRAARSDLTTPWGVRTLSSDDPTYDPQAYHEGQVWTIATAWAADAAFAAGDPALGLAYLETIAARYRAEGGWANECYRGDRPEPFDSCFVLGFSLAPFLRVLFERLWGLRPDALAATLEVRPGFPDRWTSARLRALRLGRGTVDLDWRPGTLRVRWSGPGPLTVLGGSAPHRFEGAGSAEVALGAPGVP